MLHRIMLEKNADNNGLKRGMKPLRSCTTRSPDHAFRTFSRRCHASSVSENTHTSPSSASSRDPSEAMTSSRSSFLELIGIRKKKDSCTEKKNSFGKQIFKKRKRKASESDSLQSNDEERCNDGKWTVLNVTSKFSTSENLGKAENVTKTLLPEPKQYRLQRQKRVMRFNAENKENSSCRYSGSQTSSVQRDSTKRILSSGAESRLHQRCSSRESTDTTRGRRGHRGDDDALMLHKELEMFKSRNNRLIEQLRQKSIEYSKLSSHVASLQKQVDVFRNRCRLNEDLEKWTFDDRINLHSKKILDLAVNSTLKEQETSQAAIEQLERLQRENFHLLQLRATEVSFQERHIRHLLEMMPSYDALYSFTMGILRKLGQLRATFIERSAKSTEKELELMQMRICLILANAQVKHIIFIFLLFTFEDHYNIERLKLRNNDTTAVRRRPVSYHGDNLHDRLNNAQLNFYIPLQLHGSRLEKFHQSTAVDVEAEVERNEQSIESEFLRLFDYARCK
ncbi:unnamed protein product [Enterobius vermicularis]|uniref:Protein kinase domain-containing protein n=1 Tax=Enterobius vermicularis TaxID=51028 RepID=A0A0N4UXL8_ENTVE|nr:unnamed protein product [Enterobius vermicularis]